MGVAGIYERRAIPLAAIRIQSKLGNDQQAAVHRFHIQICFSVFIFKYSQSHQFSDHFVCSLFRVGTADSHKYQKSLSDLAGNLSIHGYTGLTYPLYQKSHVLSFFPICHPFYGCLFASVFCRKVLAPCWSHEIPFHLCSQHFHTVPIRWAASCFPAWC